MSFSKKKIIIILGFSLISLVTYLLISTYMSRSPIIIVTDNSFHRLYGPERLRKQRQKISRQLFRRVIPVYVAETAGHDLIAIAVEEVFDLPEAVVFPHRYHDGARIYKENNPDIPVLVMGGVESQEEEIFIRVSTDILVDLYRAGLSAALLAKDKGVLLFSDGPFADVYRDAFQAGLRERGFLDDPTYINANAVFLAYDDIGSIVIIGPEQRFFEFDLDIPTILFSWVDPGMTPRSVKVIFDDSSWALVTDAFRTMMQTGASFNLASMPLALADRLDRNDNKMLKSFLKANLLNN